MSGTKIARKKFWIDGPLQLRVLVFVLCIIAVSLALAYLAASRGLEQAALHEERTFVSVSWAQGAMKFPFAIAAATALLAGALVTYVWAHRLIGPLMVLTGGLRRLAEGDLSRGLELRSSDVRFETTREFEHLRNALRAHAARLADVEKRFRAVSTKDNELKSIRADIVEIVSFFKL